MSRNLPRTALLGLVYEEYLKHQQTARFVNEVSRRYTQGTLQRLLAHPMRELRRAAALALGYLGDYESNAALGKALSDPDRNVRLLAETSIRKVWMRFGSESQRRELTGIVRLNAAHRYQEVIQRAGRLIEKEPNFAEAYNQRAIAHFSLGDFAESIRDCRMTLELNPYHFAAAAGLGQAYLELQDPVAALESFHRALKLNPDLEAVRVQVARLQRLIEDA
ncbi:tetratricopeptide repeat protein [Thermopirellula anaerolimosa]